MGITLIHEIRKKAKCADPYDLHEWIPQTSYIVTERDIIYEKIREIVHQYCSRCPVLLECYTYNCEKQNYGIWGGRIWITSKNYHQPRPSTGKSLWGTMKCEQCEETYIRGLPAPGRQRAETMCYKCNPETGIKVIHDIKLHQMIIRIKQYEDMFIMQRDKKRES